DIAGGIDHHIPFVPVGLLSAGVAPLDTAFGRCGEPVRVQVHHGGAGCTGDLGQLSHQQSHGSCAIDQDVVAHPARQHVPTADRTGQRLDEGGPVQVGLRPELVDVGGRCGEELLRGAVGGHYSEAVPLGTQVLMPVQAVFTFTARGARVDRHVVAHLEVEHTLV